MSKSRSVSLLVLAAAMAWADPPAAMRGPLGVQVGPTAMTASALSAKSVHRGDTVAMLVTFVAPAQPGPATLRFRLSGGTVQSPGGGLVQGSHRADLGQYEVAVNLTGVPAGQRIEVPFQWTLSGELAASVEAVLEVQGEARSEGTHGYLLAFDPNGLAAPSTGLAVLIAERQHLFADPEAMRVARTAGAVMPFDPAAFPEAMQQPSTAVRLPVGNGGTP